MAPKQKVKMEPGGVPMKGTPRLTAVEPTSKPPAGADAAFKPVVTLVAPLKSKAGKEAAKASSLEPTPMPSDTTPQPVTTPSAAATAQAADQTTATDGFRALLEGWFKPLKRSQVIWFILRLVGIHTVELLEATVQESQTTEDLRNMLNGDTEAVYDPDTHEGPINVGEANLMRRKLGCSSSTAVNIKVEGSEPGSRACGSKAPVKMWVYRKPCQKHLSLTECLQMNSPSFKCHICIDCSFAPFWKGIQMWTISKFPKQCTGQ